MEQEMEVQVVGCRVPGPWICFPQFPECPLLYKNTTSTLEMGDWALCAGYYDHHPPSQMGEVGGL